MYVDSVYAKTFKEVAKLVSPMTTVPLSGCLSFQYQRSEERGNIFSVFTRDRSGQYQELWRVGAQTQSDWSGTLSGWIPVQVDLKAPYSIQVNINAPGLTTEVKKKFLIWILLFLPWHSWHYSHLLTHMSLQVVFEVAFNSPSGGRVAVDDISFSPQFCSIDSGELQPQCKKRI